MISVIIPLYNKEAIIERTLNYVLSQNFNDYEVIIVDDGSTDRSAAIVKKFISELPSSKGGTGWVFISQENSGPSKARNTGVKNAKGEWILFLDADDELLSGSLKLFNNLLKEHDDAEIIDCCMGTRIDNQVLYLQKSFTGYSSNALRDFYLGRTEQGANQTLFRRSLCLKYPYNEKLRRYEDVELIVRMNADAKLYSSEEIVAIVNVDFSSASHAKRDITDDYVGHLDLSGSFWQKMMKYKLYIGEREYYSEQCKILYPNWRYRYDLLVLFKFIHKFKFIFK